MYQMKDLEEALSYLEIKEKDDEISYIKIGENSKNIIVSFSSASVDHYERKRSLLEPKFIDKKDYDQNQAENSDEESVTNNENTDFSKTVFEKFTDKIKNFLENAE